MEIESMLKQVGVDAMGTRHSLSQPNIITSDFYPISTDEYESMDVQLKTYEIRSKIDN